nr:MaoC family dehydratase N-terminal domain-containing protein [Nocardia bovistercoris]
MRESAGSATVDTAAVDRRRICTGPHPIDAETIAEFVRTVREFPRRDPATGRAVAPVSFAATVRTGAVGALLADFVPDGTAERILHVDQVLDLRRPLVDGDLVVCRAAIESFRHFADYHVLAIRTALVDDNGAAILSGTTSLLTRIGGDGHRCAPDDDRDRPVGVSGSDTDEFASADGAMPAIGDRIAPWSVWVPRTDLLGYARLACATGLAPSTIELAYATTYLGRRFGPDALVRRIRTQTSRHTHHLTLPAPDGAHLRMGGRVTGLDLGRRRATVALTAHAGHRALFSHASVDVQLPPRR